MTGKVVKLFQDKQFGFIKDAQGNDYFFHRSSCSSTFNEIEIGARVEFEIGDSPKGPRAEHVRIID